jgi:hypothetical protein
MPQPKRRWTWLKDLKAGGYKIVFMQPIGRAEEA